MTFVSGLIGHWVIRGMKAYVQFTSQYVGISYYSEPIILIVVMKDKAGVKETF